MPQTFSPPTSVQKNPNVGPNVTRQKSAVPQQFDIGTSAVKIVDADASRAFVSILNTGASTVYLGQSGVTSATGLPVEAGYSAEIGNASAVYARCAASNAAVIEVVEIVP